FGNSIRDDLSGVIDILGAGQDNPIRQIHQRIKVGHAHSVGTCYKSMGSIWYPARVVAEASDGVTYHLPRIIDGTRSAYVVIVQCAQIPHASPIGSGYESMRMLL